MKVLMVVSWYSPREAEAMSAGVFHYEQSIALQKYCQTALYFPFDGTLNEAFSEGMEHGLLTFRRRLSRTRIPKLEGVREILQVVSDLKRICKKWKPDVIHAHCALPAGRAAVLFGKLFGYPVVVTEHNPLQTMGLERRSGRLMTGFVYENSDANICVSANALENLEKEFPKAKFRLIYNGIIDPATVPADGETYAVAGKINFCIVAAFYSREIKGYQHLIPAVAQLKKEGFPVALHICGGGEYMEEYRRLAGELGVEEECIFYGQCRREKLYSIVSQMDFVVSASLFESAGIAVEEAMLLGKPLVVTRSGGANSLVTADTAIVTEAGSTEALTEGLREMLRRKDAFQPEQIRAYARENFEIDGISRRYMALYEALKRKET